MSVFATSSEISSISTTAAFPCMGGALLAISVNLSIPSGNNVQNFHHYMLKSAISALFTISPVSR